MKRCFGLSSTFKTKHNTARYKGFIEPYSAGYDQKLLQS